MIWAAEESNYGSGLHGSRMAVGQVEPGEWDRVQDGVRKGDALRRIGGDPDRIAEARREPGSFHAYLELHIEQGGKLDRALVPIGVVEGIVTIDDYDVTRARIREPRGHDPHARNGATPSWPRRGSSSPCARSRPPSPGPRWARWASSRCRPGAPNVVPGEAAA